MLEKGTIIVKEDYLEEGFFSPKKQTLWQKIKNNKGRIFSAIAGAGVLGLSRGIYRGGKNAAELDFTNKHALRYGTVTDNDPRSSRRILHIMRNPDGSKFVIGVDDNGKHIHVPVEKEINESFNLFNKKPTRWSRFKNYLKKNKKNIASGILGTGLIWGGARYLGKRKFNKDNPNPNYVAHLYRQKDPETGQSQVAVDIRSKNKNGELIDMNKLKDTVIDGKKKKTTSNADVTDYYEKNILSPTHLAVRRAMQTSFLL